MARMKYSTRRAAFNLTDATGKDRAVKLTDGDVYRIRVLLKMNKLTQTDISKVFGVSRQTINYIHCRTSWPDGPDPM